MPQDNSRNGVAYTEFGGLVTNADPRDIGLGAMRAENISLVTPGQLDSRKGHRPVSFANDVTSDNTTVFAMARYETPIDKFVVYLSSDGEIRAGRGAS